jgi:hypothetical protein
MSSTLWSALAVAMLAGCYFFSLYSIMRRDPDDDTSSSELKRFIKESREQVRRDRDRQHVS